MERCKAEDINYMSGLATAELWHYFYDTTVVLGYCSGQYIVIASPKFSLLIQILVFAECIISGEKQSRFYNTVSQGT